MRPQPFPVGRTAGVVPNKIGIGMTSERTRTRMVERLRQQGIQDERVLMAMRAVPRHVFVEDALASRAYEDVALPIGFGQTISQPYVVARMAELLLKGKTSLGRILEIGLGCGYQTAVLAQLATEVYAIERVGGLVRRARTHLTTLRLANVKIRHADGQGGWTEAAPFDGIIVAAAAPEVSPAWLEQLAPGGRLILPIHSEARKNQVDSRGESGASQELCVIERDVGVLPAYRETRLEPVRFVPLLGGIRP